MLCYIGNGGRPQDHVWDEYAIAGRRSRNRIRLVCFTDDAAMESFWCSPKRELVHRYQFATRGQARAALFEWIEVFYNREQFWSALGFASCVDFETQLN